MKKLIVYTSLSLLILLACKKKEVDYKETEAYALELAREVLNSPSVVINKAKAIDYSQGERLTKGKILALKIKRLDELTWGSAKRDTAMKYLALYTELQGTMSEADKDTYVADVYKIYVEYDTPPRFYGLSDYVPLLFDQNRNYIMRYDPVRNLYSYIPNLGEDHSFYE